MNIMFSGLIFFKLSLIFDQIINKKDHNAYQGQTKIHTFDELLFLFLGDPRGKNK